MELWASTSSWWCSSSDDGRNIIRGVVVPPEEIGKETVRGESDAYSDGKSKAMNEHFFLLCVLLLKNFVFHTHNPFPPQQKKMNVFDTVKRKTKKSKQKF